MILLYVERNRFGERSRNFRKLSWFSLCLLTFPFYFFKFLLCFSFLPDTTGLRLPGTHRRAGGIYPPELRPLSHQARPNRACPRPARTNQPVPGEAGSTAPSAAGSRRRSSCPAPPLATPPQRQEGARGAAVPAPPRSPEVRGPGGAGHPGLGWRRRHRRA